MAERLDQLDPLLLWLDDNRPPEIGWKGALWASTAQGAILLLEKYTFVAASLDHDLEDLPLPGHKEKTGLTVVDWMVEHNTWPTDGIVVHSWNPVGAQAMCATIDRHGPYPTKTRHIPAQGLPFHVYD